MLVLFYAAGLDYEGVGNQVIQFSSAPETICLDIGILPDDVIEGSEGFLVNLESTDPRVELTVAQARIVIADSSGIMIYCDCNDMQVYLMGRSLIAFSVIALQLPPLR